MAEIETKITEGLNEGQKEAVLTTEGPLLIVAGAGSGKTTVLIRRVAHIVSKGVDPHSILLLTFTNAAANNMLERAAAAADTRCKDVQAMTYHSFCAMTLRRYGRMMGLNPGFSIYSANDAEDLMRFIRSEHSECKKRGFPNAAAIINLISEATNKTIPLKDLLIQYDFSEQDIAIILTLGKEYEEEKRKRNVLDYDDLLVFTVRLLKNPAAHEAITRSYEYVMVDEYQDTNKIQADILFGIANRKGNIAVVGDDYQSIYAFRGADITNILDFERQVRERLGLEAKRTYLEVNYRSTQEVLDLANSVMEQKATMGFKKTLRARNESARGPVPTMTITVDKNAEDVAILNIVTGLIKNDVPASEIAVLSRSSFSTAGIEIGLTAAGVSYIKRGGVKFLEKKCIRDMLAYMSVISNPYDDTKWFRVLKLHPGIGDTYAKNIIANYTSKDFLIEHRYKRHAFYRECLLLNYTINKVRAEEDFHTQIKMLKDFYFELEERVIKEMDTDEDTRAVLSVNLEMAKEDVNVLLDLSERFSSIASFLDYITVDPSLSDKEVEDASVTVSTIHSAKGLEWDYVIVPDCASGLFPRLTENIDQEELRCFYVAITRARFGLCLCAPMSGMVFGQWSQFSVSPFLKGSEKYIQIIPGQGVDVDMFFSNFDYY